MPTHYELMKTIRIAFAGGGTGGHTYPLLAVLGAIEKEFGSRPEAISFHYFGERNEFSEEIIARASFHRIRGGKLRRYSSFANILDIPKMCFGFLEALAKFYWVMPDVLFSKGGTGAFPVVLAAWWYRIPVVIHESDSIPGLTNLLSARFAKRVAVSFESALPYFNPKKAMLTGTPVRGALLKDRLEQDAAKEKLGFDPARPLVLVVGGSQGSQRVNDLILANLKEILPLAQIYHQTGTANFLDVQTAARAALREIAPEAATASRYACVAYLKGQDGLALSAADLVLGRSGSGTLFEIAAFGKPAVLIPLPESARDHQRENAYAFAALGGAKVIEEGNLTPSILIGALRSILGSPQVAAAMGAASASFYKPEADRVIAEEVMRLAGVV